jgi:hypothetical protein
MGPLRCHDAHLLCGEDHLIVRRHRPLGGRSPRRLRQIRQRPATAMRRRPASGHRGSRAIRRRPHVRQRSTPVRRGPIVIDRAKRARISRSWRAARALSQPRNAGLPSCAVRSALAPPTVALPAPSRRRDRADGCTSLATATGRRNARQWARYASTAEAPDARVHRDGRRSRGFEAPCGYRCPRRARAGTFETLQAGRGPPGCVAPTDRRP